jgi:hypothetical protein
MVKKKRRGKRWPYIAVFCGVCGVCICGICGFATCFFLGSSRIRLGRVFPMVGGTCCGPCLSRCYRHKWFLFIAKEAHIGPQEEHGPDTQRSCRDECETPATGNRATMTHLHGSGNSGPGEVAKAQHGKTSQRPFLTAHLAPSQMMNGQLGCPCQPIITRQEAILYDEIPAARITNPLAWKIHPNHVKQPVGTRLLPAGASPVVAHTMV